MSKQITITVPDGYEDASHVVLVTPDEKTGDRSGYATVLRVEHGIHGDVAEQVVEEVGYGGYREVMIDAARIIRTGTARIPIGSAE